MSIKKRVKSFRFLGPKPVDIYSDLADVAVTLENDSFEYWVEITTPQALSSYLEKENFVGPRYPFIVVSELTTTVIEEALNAFAVASNDDFWLKLYALTCHFTSNDLDSILDRTKKQFEKDLNEAEE